MGSSSRATGVAPSQCDPYITVTLIGVKVRREEWRALPLPRRPTATLRGGEHGPSFANPPAPAAPNGSPPRSLPLPLPLPLPSEGAIHSGQGQGQGQGH